MNNSERRLNSDEILEILSQSENATAIYTSAELIIQSANDEMIRLWGKDRSVIGKSMEAAVPELKGQPFLDILHNVWQKGIIYEARDTPAELIVNGEKGVFYFDFVYRALKDAEGKVYCILHTATDVTERNINRLAAQEGQLKVKALNEELTASYKELLSVNTEVKQSHEDLQTLNYNLAESESRFRGLVQQAPVAIGILSGRDLLVESANNMMLAIWGKTPAIIGKPLADALPELRGQPFLQILDNVYTSGTEYRGNETKAILEYNGQLIENYFNFVYYPIKNVRGKTSNIIVVATEVTEQVRARQKIQESEHRLKNMVMTAPVGMTVIKGKDLIIEIANQPMLDIWGRELKSVIGKSLLELFPELHDQPFPDMLKKVFETKKRIAMPEIVADVLTDNGLVEYYLDFCYDPLFDLHGNVEAILATVLNITEQVKARKAIERAEEMLRMAVDSAELGTWYIDINSKEYIPSKRLKQFFGFYADEPMSYEESLNQVDPEYRTAIVSKVEEAILKNKPYDQEYPVTGFHDNKKRWLKATGKLYQKEDGTPAHFSGTIIDITERRDIERRKDDFISIASHELKTPTTTLKASLQLLDRMRNDPGKNVPVVSRLIEQSNKSMEKISNLIDDLLNVSRMNEGQLHLSKSTFIISDVLQNCCNHVREAGKHELIYQGDLDIEVFADEHRIDQVVVNFVNNAVKYASESTKIYMIAEKENGMVRVSVKDSGPGVSPDKLPYLFDRYYRADHSGTQYSGLGLGLFISAEIIRRHGGQIGANSELGKGATFWFTLPL